jgi:ankyrin repeat protein
MYAAWFNPNPDVARLLIDKGANVNASDKDGKKALDYAGENENLKGTDVYRLLQQKTKR